MIAENIYSNRPLLITLNFGSFNRKDRGISPSNSEIILLIQNNARHEYLPDENECIPFNFCDNI